MLNRPLLAAVCLIIVLGLAAATATLPYLRADKPGIAALLFLSLGLIAGGKALWRRPHWALSCIIAACLVIFPFVVIARKFQRIDMMSVFFHAGFGIEGASLSELQPQMAAAGICLALIVLVSYLLASLWQMKARAHLAAAMLLLAANPLAQHFVANLVRPAIASDLVKRLAEPKLRTADAPEPDLLIIYLEGLDRRFADASIYGDSYAPLAELAAEGLSFTNIGQIAGTGWSIAGLVATQCGVPIVPRGLLYRNNFNNLPQFMPARTCLSDVLTARGYATEYVVGGDLAFGGLGTFFQSHNLPTQIGFQQLAATYPPDVIAAANSNWVLDDELVFDAASKRHAALIEGTAPYALLVESIGPHGVPSYLSRHCTEAGQSITTRDTEAAVRCTVRDALAFVRSAQASHKAHRARPLMIAILSDHLSHDQTTPPVDPALTGRNTVLLIGGGVAGENNRAGSMVDVFPTLLQWLGFADAPVAAGLGHSLLSAPPTLLEQRAIAEVDAMLASDAALSRAIWAAP